MGQPRQPKGNRTYPYTPSYHAKPASIFKDMINLQLNLLSYTLHIPLRNLVYKVGLFDLFFIKNDAFSKILSSP